jgi:hypothetical protein
MVAASCRAILKSQSRSVSQTFMRGTSQHQTRLKITHSLQFLLQSITTLAEKGLGLSLTLRTFTFTPLLIAAGCLCGSIAFADHLTGHP